VTTTTTAALALIPSSGSKVMAPLRALAASLEALAAGKWRSLIVAAETLVAPPRLSLDTSDERYELRFEVPGASLSGVAVDARGQELAVALKAAVRFAPRGRLSYVRERALSRSFQLPADADESAVAWRVDGSAVVVTVPRCQALQAEPSRSEPA
jgi:HSP20 family molecular chaperone IbpA